jgi:2-iminobutanoate/2-iminopropanoate deaminase
MLKEIIESAAAPEPIGPYSQAVKAGNMLFVSGQIAINRATGTIVSTSIPDETNMVMGNLGAILKQANTSFDKVVKCSIFLKDMNNFPVVNEVYGKYFTSNPPARETVEVSRLPKDVNVEISCIAIV